MASAATAGVLAFLSFDDVPALVAGHHPVAPEAAHRESAARGASGATRGAGACGSPVSAIGATCATLSAGTATAVASDATGKHVPALVAVQPTGPTRPAGALATDTKPPGSSDTTGPSGSSVTARSRATERGPADAAVAVVAGAATDLVVAEPAVEPADASPATGSVAA